MSDDFILGPNGVEEVFMREEGHGESGDDEALTSTVRGHPTVEKCQLPLSSPTQDRIFKKFQTGRIVTEPTSGQQTDDDEDDGLTRPKAADIGVEGETHAEESQLGTEVGTQSDAEKFQLGVDAEVDAESDASDEVEVATNNSSCVDNEGPEFERISSTMLKDIKEFTISYKNKQNVDFERTLMAKVKKIDEALAEGKHIPQIDELEKDEDLYFESDDDNDDIDVNLTDILIIGNFSNTKRTSEKLETLKIDAQPQTEGSTEDVDKEEKNGVDTNGEVEANNSSADLNGQSTEDNAGVKIKAEELQNTLEALPQEIIVPIVPEQLEKLLESPENKTFLRNNLQNERDLHLTEELAESKMHKMAYFMDYLDSDHDEKVELVKSEETPEVESNNSFCDENTYFMKDSECSDSEQGTIDEVEQVKFEGTSGEKRSCDELASSAIAAQYDSDFEMSMPVAQSVESQLPPPSELGTGEIVLKAFLDVKTPILELEEQSELPSAIDETPEVEISDVDLQANNQNHQTDPNSSNSSSALKKNKKKAKLGTNKKRNRPSRQPVPCPVEGCGKVLCHTESLNKHIDSQHTKGTCEACDLTFDRIVQLNNHMNDKHTPEDQKVVKKKVGRKPQPKPEIPRKKRRKCFPCTKCPSTFTYDIGLFRHLGRVHGEVSRPFSCYFCSRGFFSYSNLQAHIVIHTMERAHRCPICSKDFNQTTILQGHMAKIHAPKGSRAPMPKKFLCSICGKRFGNSWNLKSHESVVHLKLRPFACDLCDAKFGHKPDLTIHKLYKHGKKRDIMCDRCGKKFQTKKYVNIHIAAVHEKTRNQCPHCEKAYVDRTDLQEHIKKAHTEGYQPPSFICSVKNCGKSFLRSKNRDEHFKRCHTKERPFKCEHKECKMAFFTPLERNYHSASHSNSSPYGCVDCESAFKSKPSLRSHLRKVHKYSVQAAQEAVDKMDLA